MMSNLSAGDRQPSFPRGEFLLVLAAALLVQGAVLVARFDQLQADPDLYKEIAGHLLHEGRFARTIGETSALTAFRPPLYPLLIAIVGAQPLGIAVLHAVLGLTTVASVWGLGRWWGLGRGALLAAAMCIADPILLNQSTLVMTETLAACLAALALLALTALQNRPGKTVAVTAGVVLGLACLCRPTFLPWLALILCVLLWQARRGVGNYRNVLLVACAAALLLAPWIVRNTLVFGRPIATTTHGGYTLWLGNNQAFYAYLRKHPPGVLFDAEKELPPLDAADDPPPGPQRELLHDRRAQERAAAAIAAEPGMFAYACLVRVGRLVRPAPHALSPQESTARRLLRYAIGSWYLLLFGLAIGGMTRIGWRSFQTPWLWGLLLCLSLIAVHTFYWSNMRMRAPAAAFLCLAAAAAVWKPPYFDRS